MIVTTTGSVEGRSVSEYLGVCAGEAVVGANIVRDVVGGRSGSYEKVLRSAREDALEIIAEVAAERGADAVIGVSLDYEVVGDGGSMLMVVASGTAVKLA